MWSVHLLPLILSSSPPPSLSLSLSAESVSRYLGLVLAGLAGSAHMVSASVISLSRLLYEFHGEQGLQWFVGGV